MNKILIVGPNWVGDLIMSQALLKLLKVERPNSMIDVLAPSWATPILQRMPEVKSSLVLPTNHGELGIKKRFFEPSWNLSSFRTTFESGFRIRCVIV